MKKVPNLVALLFLMFLGTQLYATPPKGTFCPKEGQGMCKTGQPGMHHHCQFKGSIKYALKHLNLSNDDWADVKLAFKTFRDSMQKIQKGIPIKSLDNGKFNKELFIKESPMHQKLAAKAELLETIYLILNDEQKKRFQMLIGAHQDKIRSEGYQGCQGGMCQGKICPVDGKKK